MITVTKPFTPPLEDFIPYLDRIWKNGQLTNNGPFHQELESALSSYLGVPYISLFTNATLGLLTAMQALNIKNGEVITTPYSFVATTHSITWNGNSPVFVDIEPSTGNLDAKLVEQAITSQTKAILPVHVYGTPCDVNAFDEISKKYNIPVIYDAAHCFGVKHHNQSILNFGDLSVISFHATKVFNTFEGGAIVCKDEKMKQRIDDLKNFGFRNETTVIASGINSKMSEIQAAFGLLQLNSIEQLLDRRREIAAMYRKALNNLNGLRCHQLAENSTENGSYFPVYISKNFSCTRDEFYKKLQDTGIFGRRYFYPLISNFELYNSIPSADVANLPVANSIANEVLCLPIYPDLSNEQVNQIIQTIKNIAHGK
jgi:dTDP-4-amino-4,6-dideoxygalactose transaminase